MKYYWLYKATTFLMVLYLPALLWGQIAINTDGSSADASAMLDITATDKGMLIPRMSSTDRDAISSPATGLLIFNSSSNVFEYYDGGDWTVIGAAGGLTISSNIALDGNYLSGDGENEGIFVDSIGNVGIATNTPQSSSSLDLAATDRALLLNRLTTAQRNTLSAVEGMVIFNTDTKKFQGCENAGIKVDQEATSQASNFAISAGTNWSAFGQAFVAGETTDLLQVEFSISTVTTGGDYVIRVFSGAGFSGSVLASETVTVSSPGILNVPFTNPAAMTAGSTYTVQIADINHPSVATGNITIHWSGSNVYTNGSSYYTESGSDVEDPTLDLYFRILISGVSWIDLN